MIDIERMKRKAKSRFFLSSLTQSELYRLDYAILEIYCTRGVIPKPNFDLCCLAITSLMDCGYLRCGISNDMTPVYKTTESGKKYMERIFLKYGSCTLSEAMAFTECRQSIGI